VASLETLLRIHSRNTSYYGSSFNPRPEPDAFGRRDATPLERQRAINGEFNLPEDKPIFKGRKFRKRK